MDVIIDLDYLAVLLAAVAYFVIGFLWYTPLFGKVWAKHMGMADADAPGGAAMARSLALNFVGNLLVALVFLHVLEAFTPAAWYHGDPSATTRDIPYALQGAFWVWLGFFLPKELTGMAWEGHNWIVASINASYHIVSLVVMAIILTVL